METLFIERDGKKIRLTEIEIEDIYRAKAHDYHVQDARRHTEDWLENDDDIAESPWAVPQSDIDNGALNGLFDDMATEFESRKDCSIADNDLWSDIVDRFAKPLAAKNAAARIMEELTYRIIPNDECWGAFVKTVQSYARPSGDDEIAVVVEAVQRGGLRGNPSEKTLQTIRRVLENGDYYGLLQFCAKHLPRRD